MSTSYNIAIIYGFKADSPVKRDRKTGQATYLGEWLDENYPELQQYNAGCSNGGSPDFFVGILLHEVNDFTRGQAYTLISPADYDRMGGAISEKQYMNIRRARIDLAALDVVPIDVEIGFYLIGDAA